MKKSAALSLAMAFASMGEAQLNSTPRMAGGTYGGRLIPLTKKQKARRKLNKIGRKTRKLNFKN